MTPQQIYEAVSLLRKLEETNMCLRSIAMEHNTSKIQTNLATVEVRRESVRPILEAHRDWLNLQIRDLGVSLS